MAVGIPATNVVMIVIGGGIGAGKWNNIFHAQYSGQAPSVAQLNTLATTLTTSWTTNFAPLVNTGVSLTQVDLADLTNPAASATKTTQNVTGTRTGSPLSGQAAAVISWQINVRYRGGHPRTYVPGPVNTDLTNASLWTTPYKTALLAAANAWRTTINGLTTGATTYQMVAVSFRTNNLPRPTGVPYTINSAVIHGRVDTQRHRLGKETP